MLDFENVTIHFEEINGGHYLFIVNNETGALKFQRIAEKTVFFASAEIRTFVIGALGR